MPITQGISRDIPVAPSLNFGDYLGQFATAYMGKKDEMEKAKRAEVLASFPTLAAQHMVRQAQPGETPAFNNMGVPWVTQPPSVDTADLINKEKLADMQNNEIPLKTIYGNVAADWRLTGGPKQDFSYSQQDIAREAVKTYAGQGLANQWAKTGIPASEEKPKRATKPIYAGGRKLREVETYKGQQVFLGEDGKYYTKAELGE